MALTINSEQSYRTLSRIEQLRRTTNRTISYSPIYRTVYHPNNISDTCATTPLLGDACAGVACAIGALFACTGATGVAGAAPGLFFLNTAADEPSLIGVPKAGRLEFGLGVPKPEPLVPKPGALELGRGRSTSMPMLVRGGEERATSAARALDWRSAGPSWACAMAGS